jgi:Rod binding domain-containing protein
VTAPIGTPTSGVTDPARARELLKAAQDLEGVFYRQMLQAMRDASPEGGIVPASPGETMFRQMFDDVIAGLAVERQQRGLAQQLYRQLARHLPSETGSPAGQPGMAEERDVGPTGATP